MSYTTLYKVPKSGEIEEYAEFSNAYRGAFNVWLEMGKHYLGLEHLPMTQMKPVWDLSNSVRVPLNDRIVMGSTFDKVMVRREHLLVLADAIDDFATRFEPGHLPQQAEKLRILANDETCFAVCWTQTSVSSDTWLVMTDDVDEYGDRVYRMYDVAKDSGHWYLFDEIPLPEQSQQPQEQAAAKVAG